MTLTITQRDDELLELVVRDRLGALIDLTGCDLWFYVKKSRTDLDANAIIAKDPVDVIINADQVANKGQATVAIDPADTENITLLGRTLRYEVQLKDSTNKISTIATGDIVIEADLVRTTT